MNSRITQISEGLFSLREIAFPPVCVGCETYCEEDSFVCAKCWARLHYFDSPFCLTCHTHLPEQGSCPTCRERMPLFALADYAEPMRDIILQIKFHNVTSPIAMLSAKLVATYGERLRSLGADDLVPVPLHRMRFIERGYNQAELIAEAISKPLGIPVENTILCRIAKKKPQAKLRASARASNIRGVFDVLERDSETSPSVLLVDDVVTSGETAREAVRTLLAAGIQVKGVLSIAHGE